ncbi:hypothetical protein [Phosphitispora fastidiosa]|uniref:hypothetical protein n=1 Tax=Phosphitispora fastidiosa TaxID=2837202 RepID=UPI001E2BF4C9|nr:hypothetical protein [Phosphitispora fastidiosa]MBU7006208.1 hypothetical protein [Phosphitispora fastidiosa]
MKKLIVCVLLSVFLATAGCGQGDPQNKTDKTVEGGTNTQQRDREKEPGNAGLSAEPGNTGMQGKTPQVQTDKVTVEMVQPTDNSKTAESGEDLVIKSDNRVSAGSGQALVSEMDKEINSLVKSLENLDTISDSDLEVE